LENNNLHLIHHILTELINEPYSFKIMHRTACKIRYSILAGLFLLSSFLAAQTSGPTTPEYTSFEPVDAMIWLTCPQVTWYTTIPLLEVPGPEGGYL